MELYKGRIYDITAETFIQGVPITSLKVGGWGGVGLGFYGTGVAPEPRESCVRVSCG